MPESPIDALAQALFLSITAPSEEKSADALELAEQFSNGLNELDVARAKRYAAGGAALAGAFPTLCEDFMPAWFVKAARIVLEA